MPIPVVLAHVFSIIAMPTFIHVSQSFIPPNKQPFNGIACKALAGNILPGYHMQMLSRNTVITLAKAFSNQSHKQEVLLV